MAQPSSLRVQTLDGTWETLGVDRFVGIVPESVRPSADEGGPSTLSFQLQRNPDIAQLDLLAWTPCEVEVAGKTVWEGRIRETPGTHAAQQLIAISGEGWQNHLDDDSLERVYVYQDLTAWGDTRSISQSAPPWINLAAWVSAPSVTTAQGSVTLALPNGSALVATSAVGVTLDLGPAAAVVGGARTLTFDCIITGAVTNVALVGRTHQTPDPLFATLYSDLALGAGTTTLAALGNGTHVNICGTFTTGYRYVSIFLYVGGAFTPAADVSLQITRALVGVTGNVSTNPTNPFGASQGASDLRASDVILDAIQQTSPLLTCTPKSPAYRDEILADNPLSFYRLSNNLAAIPAGASYGGAGQLWTYDLGSLNNPITNALNVSVVASLLADDTDQALSFTGTGYVAAAYAALFTTGMQTIEASIQPSNANGSVNQNIVTIDADLAGHDRIALQINSANRLQIACWNGTAYITWAANSLALTNGTIYHLIVMHDGAGTATLLVNNVAQTLTPSGSLASLVAGSGDVSIGADAGNSTNFYFGVIDDVSIYGYCLSPVQQTNHYQTARARLYGGVQRSQFKIPHYAPSGAQTGRQHAAAVNALHGWQVRVLPSRKLIFQPQPTAVQLIAAPGITFNEGGSNTADQIYNRCAVEGQDAVGNAVRLSLGAGQVVPNSPVITSTVQQPTNPSFEVNTTGWTASLVGTGTTFSRVTSPVHSGVGAGQIAQAVSKAWGGTITTTPPSGTYVRGLTYLLTFWVYVTGGGSGGMNITAILGSPTAPGPATNGLDNGYSSIFVASYLPAWTPVAALWTPLQNYPASAVQAAASAATVGHGHNQIGTGTVTFDDFAIGQIAPTVMDKRGFAKTKILSAQSAIDVPTANILAESFLLSAYSMPFRGSFVASSPTDVLIQPGNQPVHPSELLLHTNELIRLPLVNPDTGDIGRDGKIVQIAYDGDAEAATVTIDDDRANFDALLARMAIVSTATGA